MHQNNPLIRFIEWVFDFIILKIVVRCNGIFQLLWVTGYRPKGLRHFPVHRVVSFILMVMVSFRV